MNTQDLLCEIRTEELPPKALTRLRDAFLVGLEQGLAKACFKHGAIQAFATPCRLALLITDLAEQQEDTVFEKRGPAWHLAFEENGSPTQACQGFAASCQVAVSDLYALDTAQGRFVGARIRQQGQSLQAVLPGIVEQALKKLPVPKVMRWGAAEFEFARPVHSLILLYGDEVIPATLLGVVSDRVTRGHRNYAHPVTLHRAQDYEAALEKAQVIASVEKRKERILQQITALEKQQGIKVLLDETLLDEVTALVECPVALLCQFDPRFLSVPQEALILAMQHHQKSFSVRDSAVNLKPCFVTISNLESRDERVVVLGNERVMRARLSDAAFFYTSDQKVSLEARVEKLSTIVYQKELGSLLEKVQRVEKLALFLADLLQADADTVQRAAYLCKADLTSQMVGEFPLLQGIMGGYYAMALGEPIAVARAVMEHYRPAFSGDAIPTTDAGCMVALADRIDTLVGLFGIGLWPTGDKDPFALRRTALGLVRIIIEKKYTLSLRRLIVFALELFGDKLSQQDTADRVLHFIHERHRALTTENAIMQDVFAAVAALNLDCLLDIDRRLHAVQQFKSLAAASALSLANKRVSNLLNKFSSSTDYMLDFSALKQPSEQALAFAMRESAQVIMPLYEAKEYAQVLERLSALKAPIDNFFHEVLVMSDDESERSNRLALLIQLRQLFLKIADIALLQ